AQASCREAFYEGPVRWISSTDTADRDPIRQPDRRSHRKLAPPQATETGFRMAATRLRHLEVEFCPTHDQRDRNHPAAGRTIRRAGAAAVPLFRDCRAT